MGKKLVCLTVDESEAHDRAIDFYRYCGKPDAEVMTLAWIDIQRAFPRLKEYDAAEVSA
ncbi:MAG TPA: hypothetical protein VMZ25_07800 [Terriglobales bacterium]|nr:hypothetical protein [Terriglobales bacterium]